MILLCMIQHEDSGIIYMYYEQTNLSCRRVIFFIISYWTIRGVSFFNLQGAKKNVFLKYCWDLVFKVIYYFNSYTWHIHTLLLSLRMVLICGLSPTLGTSSLMSLSVSMRKAAPDTLFLLKLSMTSLSTFLSERKLPNSSTVNDSTADADDDAMANSSSLSTRRLRWRNRAWQNVYACASTSTPRPRPYCILIVFYPMVRHTLYVHQTTRALGILSRLC